MGKSKKAVKNSIIGYLFISFFVLAFSIVFFLEHLEKEKIFVPTKADRTAQTEKAHSESLYFTLNSKSLFNKDTQLIDYFIDEDHCEHITVKLSENKLPSFLKKLKRLIKSKNAKITLVETRQEHTQTMFLYHVFKDNTRTHILLLTSMKHTITPQETSLQNSPENRVKKAEKRVAIIIDDIGSKKNVVNAFKHLSIPLTLSVLTDEPYAAHEILLAKEIPFFEIMIHIPMQPYTENFRFTDRTITPNSSQKTIVDIIKKARQVIPFAKGVNNHQGSLTTADEATMKLFLTALKAENLYFIDSRTTSTSVAYKIAQDLKIRSSYKDLFLDHIPNLEHSREQFSLLIRLLQTKDTVIAIGHPHDSTLQAIKEAIPLLQKLSIQFVHASALVH
jgi:polysaccharide deacetylase 2 family uncharacterized protein YibQ